MGKKKMTGSQPAIKEGAAKTGHTDTGKEIKILVTIQGKKMADTRFESHLKDEHTDHLDHDAFAEQFGASQEDIDQVKAFAAEFGLTVSKINPVTRSIVISGTVKEFNRAFDVNIMDYIHPDNPDQSFHTHEEEISVPEELHGIVTGIFGLHDQPVLKRKALQNKDKEKLKIDRAAAAMAPTQAPKEKTGSAHLLPTEIASYYNFPKDLTGKGQSIAVLATTFTGFYQDDIDYYLKELIGVPPKQINCVEVNGAKNNPGSFCGDLEATQDLQILSALAPDADVSIYFTKSTQYGMIDALHEMIGTKERKHSIISISWFSKESDWSPFLADELKRVFFTAAKLGITVCVSSGDKGAYDGVNIFTASPFVLSCGGSEFTYKEDQPKTIANVNGEEAWNDQMALIKSTDVCKSAKCRNWEESGVDCPIGKFTKSMINFVTGGGESDFYSRPDYQAKVEFNPGEYAPKPPEDPPGRVYPDVAGYAPLEDPGVAMWLHGQSFAGGGTSSVAPLYAALFARINQKLVEEGKKNAGFVTQKLYELAETQYDKIFNDITGGNSYAEGVGYAAGPGWDPCTGWGSINGTGLLNALIGQS